jgi:hypothetical protein
MLQKFIRRNKVQEAKWCAAEWALFTIGANDKNTIKSVKGIISNLRNRLIIIYLEDIGIANVDLWVIIDPLLDLIQYGNPLQTIVNAAVKIAELLASSPGCRMASYCNSLFKIMENNLFLKELRPFMKHFPIMNKELKLLESIPKNITQQEKESLFYQAIENKCPTAVVIARDLMNPVKDGKRSNTKYGKNQIMHSLIKRINNPYYKLSKKWFDKIHNSESWLAIIVAILSQIFPINECKSNYQAINIDMNYDIEMHKQTPFDLDSIPQYCKDMHVTNSQNLRKNNIDGVTHWINEASYIDNEYCAIGYMNRKIFYQFSKYLSVGEINKDLIAQREQKISIKRKIDNTDGISRVNKKLKIIQRTESKLFNNVLRVQITTGRAKTDTFIATLSEKCNTFNSGDKIFVKGPFNHNSPIFETIKKLDLYKQLFGLPRIRFEIVQNVLLSKVFSDEINVKELASSNFRYNKNPTTGSFIMFESLLEESIHENYPKIRYGELSKHKSKTWQKANAFILDPQNLKQLDWKIDLANEYIRYQYVLAMLFRFLFGITDHADRNFVVDGNLLYGVDEENISFETDIKFSGTNKHSKKCEFICQEWSSVFDANVKETLQRWKLVVPNEDLCLSRLNYAINNPKIIFKHT